MAEIKRKIRYFSCLHHPSYTPLLEYGVCVCSRILSGPRAASFVNSSGQKLTLTHYDILRLSEGLFSLCLLSPPTLSLSLFLIRHDSITLLCSCGGGDPSKCRARDLYLTACTKADIFYTKLQATNRTSELMHSYRKGHEKINYQ